MSKSDEVFFVKWILYIYIYQIFGTANLILKVLLLFVALYFFQVGCDELNNNDKIKRMQSNP